MPLNKGIHYTRVLSAQLFTQNPTKYINKNILANIFKPICFYSNMSMYSDLDINTGSTLMVLQRLLFDLAN